MTVLASTSLVALSSWSEITHDFGENWLIYLSMPLIAAFVGWSTKIVALEMLYRPLEFKGIGPIGSLIDPCLYEVNLLFRERFI